MSLNCLISSVHLLWYVRVLFVTPQSESMNTCTLKSPSETFIIAVWYTIYTESNHSDLYCIDYLNLFQSLCQRTPLHVAVEEGQECTVETLVEKYEADINYKDKDGVSKEHVFTTFTASTFFIL